METFRVDGTLGIGYHCYFYFSFWILCIIRLCQLCEAFPACPRFFILFASSA